MSIPFILFVLLAVASLLWLGAYAVQFAVAAAVILCRIILVLVGAVGVLVASMGWAAWFLVRPKAAMASLRQARRDA